jgi:hypothetical protein
VDALRTVLKVWQEMGAADKNPGEVPVPSREAEASMRQLHELETAGLLEAHVLFARANQDIAADYPAYRDANRAKLHDYLLRYYLHAN